MTMILSGEKRSAIFIILVESVKFIFFSDISTKMHLIINPSHEQTNIIKPISLSSAKSLLLKENLWQQKLSDLTKAQKQAVAIFGGM